MTVTGSLVVGRMIDEFQEEEITKPEISESMAQTLERLRTEHDPCERPSVHANYPTIVHEETT